MTFHPRMYATVRGFTPVEDLSAIRLEAMTIDYWKVQGMEDARGHYVSMHPRFVFFLDDRSLLLSPAKGTLPSKAAAGYIPAGLEVRGRIDKPGPLRHIDIHLPLKALKRIAGANVDLGSARIMADTRAVAPYLQILAAEAKQRSREDDHIEALVATTIREFFFAAEHPRRQSGTKRIPLDQLRAFVLEQLGRRISVEELAETAGLSRSHFNRSFRAEANQSPHQWVRSLRIKQAKRLLQAGRSYAEIADLTGFADQAHFNRAFKAHTGTTPGRWTIEHTTCE